MNRREFLRVTSVGALTALSSDIRAAENQPASLPLTQDNPLPQLGTHWPNVFQKLSSRCQPRMSFLEGRFRDPQSWSETARATLFDHLHYNPPPCDPAPEVVEKVDRGSYVRERVLINIDPDIRVAVYCLIPKNLQGPAPAVVNLHDHGGFYFWGKEKVVHVEPEHPALAKFKRTYYGGRSTADELAKRGYVVIAPDMLHWGERGLYLDADPERIRKRTMDVTADDVVQFNARSWAHEELLMRTALTCGVTWAGINIWGDLRVTDYLLTRPEVDAKRVGCIGLSLGSVRSIYLGALHRAVRASVAVCWMSEYQPLVKCHVRNTVGFTKLVPGLYNDLDWPDLAGLHWPGALMTISGTQDGLFPFSAVERAIEKCRAIFTKMGCPEKYEGVIFEGPHEFNLAMQERAFNWLTGQLRDAGTGA